MRNYYALALSMLCGSGLARWGSKDFGHKPNHLSLWLETTTSAIRTVK